MLFFLNFRALLEYLFSTLSHVALLCGLLKQFALFSIEGSPEGRQRRLYAQFLCRSLQSFFDNGVLGYRLIFEDIPDCFEVLVLDESEGHVIVIVIDGLIDFIIDYNLILFIPHMLENAVFISTLSFSHEVFAVLNGSEEDSES